MDEHEFLKQQFITLRDEIRATKQRAFLIVLLGLIAVPIVAYLAESANRELVAPMLPFLILVLTVLYFVEQNALMRCGQFIRCAIEPQIKDAPGWETWLESKPDLRTMDKYFGGCFLIVFFVYYFLAVGLAIHSLWLGGSIEAAEGINWRVAAGGVTYGIGAVWMFITLLHHWRSCTTTTA
ncbi:MAG TPA: hypothetical protein VGM03_13075 [Phycisphaerae bacterium]|jgi:hypothetical protein